MSLAVEAADQRRRDLDARAAALDARVAAADLVSARTRAQEQEAGGKKLCKTSRYCD